jgi:predicted dinucleotide-binding enzyme
VEAELKGRPSSLVNAGRVPGAALVKAFNHLPMKTLTSPVPDGGKRVLFVSSDDEGASAKVAQLIDKLGFAPIEIGALTEGGMAMQPPKGLVFHDLIQFPKP